MNTPNFILVGTGKAATTSLNHYLAAHPDVFMCPVKEPNFFALEGKPVNFQGPQADQKINKWSVNNKADYQRLFNQAKGYQTIGEVSPLYLYDPDTAANIHRHIPEVKIIAVLRNPVERAFSAYQYLFYQKREPEKKFADALKLETQRIANNWEWIWHYKNLGFYFRQLKRYTTLFPVEQIKICLYEDLQNDPRNFMQEIFRFIGVDHSADIDLTRKLKRSVYPFNHSRQHNILQLILGPFRNRTLTPQVRAALIETYRSDIMSLAQYINRDLSTWL